MIIGIAGPTASGKTTVARLLEKDYEAIRMRYSAILAEMARSRGQDAEDKETLQNLYLSERKLHGENFLAEEMKKSVSLLHPEILIIEGNRRLADIDMLKELSKERNEKLLIVFIDAEENTRFERYNKRMRELGEDEITTENFNKLEKNDAEDEVNALREIAQNEGLYINTDKYNEEETTNILKEKIDNL